MSTISFSFKARIAIDDEVIPLASEITSSSSSASDGVQNGFVFKLDRQPTDPPVIINLGQIIDFIEQKLGAGAGALSKNPNLSFIQQLFPGSQSAPFDNTNTTLIQIQDFEINSSPSQRLFSISVDVAGSSPSGSIINLPGELASWLAINNLAISFSATTKNS